MDPRLESLNTLLVETFNAILTVTELHLLDAVAQDEQATISSLAAATRVTVSTMTTGVKRLEAKQYLERVRETADRRVVRVRLTERGRALAYAHKRFHRRMARAVVDGLPEQELDALTRAMENLRDFFREEGSPLHTDMQAPDEPA